jgi:hypothetical protein
MRPGINSGLLYFCIMNKRGSLFSLVLLVAIACAKSADSGDPADHLNEFERKGLMMEIVHYAAKLPPQATHQNKFESRFDEYYSNVALDYKWLSLKSKDGGGYWFLVSRPARSITPMVEGIGGYFKVEKDTLVEYDELFRTWKMPEEVFLPRGKMLFERMVQGKDLSIYYPQFTGDQYIEFPNGQYVFDKERRMWASQQPEIRN